MMPIVFAMYGGESEIIYQFNDCHNISVYVEGNLTIDEGEYSFKDCNETGLNLWTCNCDNGFNVTLETKLNTVNNYNIVMNYTNATQVIIPVPSVPSRGGGGSRRSGGEIKRICISEWNCTEWSECINSFKHRTCVDINNCSDSIFPDIDIKCDINHPPVIISNPVKNEDIPNPVHITKEENILNGTSTIEKVKEEPNKIKMILILIILAIVFAIIIIVVILNEKK